ncbi:MAG TPA: hypothetical protein VFT22_20640 [Kofleriaceae bacterium]|nr:hypothetical protein [Kofleriaceae bacterium]
MAPVPISLRVIWIAAALACSGTSSSPAGPAAPPAPVHAAVADAAVDATPLDQDLPRLVERAITMYQDISRAFAASGSDCAAATRRLGQLASAYRDVTTANAKVLHDGRAKELKAALEPRAEAFDAGARQILAAPTMSKCAQDPAFTKALDELLGASP